MLIPGRGMLDDLKVEVSDSVAPYVLKHIFEALGVGGGSFQERLVSLLLADKQAGSRAGTKHSCPARLPGGADARAQQIAQQRQQDLASSSAELSPAERQAAEQRLAELRRRQMQTTGKASGAPPVHIQCTRDTPSCHRSACFTPKWHSHPYRWQSRNAWQWKSHHAWWKAVRQQQVAKSW